MQIELKSKPKCPGSTFLEIQNSKKWASFLVKNERVAPVPWPQKATIVLFWHEAFESLALLKETKYAEFETSAPIIQRRAHLQGDDASCSSINSVNDNRDK